MSRKKVRYNARPGMPLDLGRWLNVNLDVQLTQAEVRALTGLTHPLEQDLKRQLNRAVSEMLILLVRGES